MKTKPKASQKARKSTNRKTDFFSDEDCLEVERLMFGRSELPPTDLPFHDHYRPKIDVDQVHSPPHYTDGGIETIDFIEAKRLNYNTGNAVKYVSRAGKKNPETEIQDLEKAIWYLNREIKRLSAEK